MVVDITPETKRAKTFRLALAHPSPHLAGPALRRAPHRARRLHRVALVLRGVARPTGRTRSTSPSSGSIDGEVSTFLHDEVVIGDELEVRGPIGGFFVWKGDTPALLVGGGSGVVPLMAMLRLARKLGKQDLVRLVVSVRAPDELLLRVGDPRARDEHRLHAHDAADDYPPRAGRLTPEDLAPLLARDQTAYVCGSAGFADAASHLVVDLGDPRAPGARRTVRPDVVSTRRNRGRRAMTGCERTAYALAHAATAGTPGVPVLRRAVPGRARPRHRVVGAARAPRPAARAASRSRPAR